ncbi:AmmeMemoRadiSam system protein B [Candidatus Woesearchaeota archaeon]|nr:MAG: AmmeMemoRadiSam system protein B [Candidatus Woesearchaeota archaeon]
MSVRKPAVAGAFYSKDPEGLRAAVLHLVGESAPDNALHGVIVPHAGYSYSGAVAATAYRRIPRETRHVLLLGPSHHASFRGVALDTHEAWETPLGTTELLDATHLVGGLFKRLREAHTPEHSLEVQLPFLQVVAPDAHILPLLVHNISAADAEAVAHTLLAAYPGACWVVSSDLSHYLPLTVAQQRDAETLAAIKNLDLSGELDACGCFPLLVAMAACRAQGWSIELLRYATSAEAGGDASAVVGYAALRF